MFSDPQAARSKILVSAKFVTPRTQNLIGSQGQCHSPTHSRHPNKSLRKLKKRPPRAPLLQRCNISAGESTNRTNTTDDVKSNRSKSHHAVQQRAVGHFLELATCNMKQDIAPLEESQGQLRSSKASGTIPKTSSECFMVPKNQAMQL